ncbi:MAG: ribosome silencing factor [Prevotellaceae bacterium]|jgi:ribosome-associated protein|nr:ribosome silencing factor [Prevotellaceae bacterium]
MTKDKEIVDKIVEGIQEKKGKNIIVVNLTKLNDAPCSYFVICEGDSTVHVNAIALSVKDWVRDRINVKPFASDGFENCQWIAMDYGQAIVHIFQPSVRLFYDIEHLWLDADIVKIEDLI